MTMPRSVRNVAKGQSYLLNGGSKSNDCSAVLPMTTTDVSSSSNESKANVTSGSNKSIGGAFDLIPKITRKVPLKSFSSANLRRNNSGPLLPDYTKMNNSVNDMKEEAVNSDAPASPVRRARRGYRAIEKADGSILPTSASGDEMSSQSKLITRAYTCKPTSSRTRSIGDTFNNATRRIRGRSCDELPLFESQKSRSEQFATPSLRSRRTRTVTLDRDDFGHQSADDCDPDYKGNAGGRSSWLPWGSNNSLSDSNTAANFRRKFRRNNRSYENLLPLTNPGGFNCVPRPSSGRSRSFQFYGKTLIRSYSVQILVLFVLTYFVYDSYYRTNSLQMKLERFHEKESMAMLHLKTVEQHLSRLQESLSRLSDVSGNAGNANDNSRKNSSKKEAVDSDLIRAQTQQLYQMEEELDHELRALQSKIQTVARGSIVSTYGEGPVQIVLELDYQGEDGGYARAEQNSISILLWYDTPHAAWTWIQQIRKGIWQEAKFQMGKASLTLDSFPAEERNIMKSGSGDENDLTLKFVEKSKKSHEPWTVGLRETETGLAMFINLQDNSAYHKHDVCVGKVIDGFDALQRLVDASRRMEGTGKSVMVKHAQVTHVTRGQAQGLP